MRFLIIFIIFVHALLIPASYGFLDLETTTVKNFVLPKAVRNFVKINLDKSETLNERNYNHRTTTQRQEIEIPNESTSHEVIDTTINANLVTTAESKLHSDTTTTRGPLIPDERIQIKKPEPETNPSVLWFFSGALAGVLLSFIVFSIYSFFKSRTESIYQNL
ncbi:unnamed protein product [Chironomus riparius]|uniref:Uncharacterized protein n=1 Tax=Chironomus riparius TaxID=315576 RepID=A0A9N9S3T2_9DIPT|nr:unnamed protein product [Chironomus riparius]